MYEQGGPSGRHPQGGAPRVGVVAVRQTRASTAFGRKTLVNQPSANLMTAWLAVLLAPAAALAQQPLELPRPPAPESIDAPAGEGSTVEADGFRPLAPISMPALEELHLDAHLPAETESTGTWLRRGLWFVDIEAVILSRIWNNNRVVLIGETEAFGVGSGLPALASGEIGESSPGWDGLPRLTLGRFLFRDLRNRDHTAEFVASGGAEWDEFVSVASVAPNALFVPISIHQGRVNFTGASESNFDYSSRIYNLELNYQVTDRLDKDRMELQPDGRWVRRAVPGVTKHYLAGLRYVDLEEDVDWFAGDIINPSIIADSGDYRVLASNNLFGPQFGGGLTIESDRWNVTFEGKFGALINDARATGDLRFTNPITPGVDFSTDVHDNTVSYLMQWNITARYHIRPNASLRFGWETMYLTSTALAPNQLSFDPNQSAISLTGDVWYNGITMGAEFFW